MSKKNPYAIPYTDGRTEHLWKALAKEIALKIDALRRVTDDLGKNNDQGSLKWLRPADQIADILHDVNERYGQND